MVPSLSNRVVPHGSWQATALLAVLPEPVMTVYGPDQDQGAAFLWVPSSICLSDPAALAVFRARTRSGWKEY
jgi:hypothetical protein